MKISIIAGTLAAASPALAERFLNLGLYENVYADHAPKVPVVEARQNKYTPWTRAAGNTRQTNAVKTPM
jgi:hypothetical protein